MTPLEDSDRLSAWVNLVQTGSVVAAAIEERLQQACGLSLAEHELLVRLGRAPERRLRMLDLANLLLVSKSGATRMVDRLTKEGLVERALCSTDRRVIYAGLTDKGRDVLAGATPIFTDRIEQHFSSHLSRSDIAAL